MPLLNSIAREAAAYTSIYHGRTIVLKVSGEEIDGPGFGQLVEDVQYLTASGVCIIMAVGGGHQVRKHFAGPRNVIGGTGVTTAEVMQLGVLPAWEELRKKLQAALPAGVILESRNIACVPHPDQRLGLAGVPTDIKMPHEPLVIAGFVGQSAGESVNVDSGDVAIQIARQYADEIEELIFLSTGGGIATVDGEITSLLTDKRVERILGGEHGDIVVNDEVRKQLADVRRALEVISKVVVTDTGGLREEIEKWMGSGTLCVDTKQLVASRMRFTEGDIFDAVHATYVEKGIFRPRTPEQINELKIHHRVLRAGNSPLGGFSAVPKGEWLELSAVWAGTIGNGIGRMLLDAAHTEAGRRKMYALSTNDDAIRTFSNHPGYEHFGQLADVRLTRAAQIPQPLADYDTTARNPHLFLKRNV